MSTELPLPFEARSLPPLEWTHGDQDAKVLAQLLEVATACSVGEPKTRFCLELILDTAIRLTQADRGNIQLLEPGTPVLIIAAQRGFKAPFLKFFQRVDGGAGSACHEALVEARRVIVEDVESSPIYTEPARQAMLEAKALAVQSTPLVSSQGKVVGMISTHFSAPLRLRGRDWNAIDLLACLAADFLERRHALDALKASEQSLKRLNEELESQVTARTAVLLAANEQLQSFTHSVAHDLRQQIRGINSNAAILLKDHGGSLPTEAESNLQRLINSSKQLGQFVDDLLSYARFGKQDVSRSQTDLSAISLQVIEDLRDSGQPQASFSVEAGLGAFADESMVRIVLQNLIENAVKYSADSPDPTVAVGRRGEAFFVQDNGVGIDPRYENKVFRPFERLEREDKYPGTGIGLANAKRIVERHGGTIWFERPAEEGVAFFFTLG